MLDVGGVAVVGMTVKAERRWKTPEWKQTSYSSSLPSALPSTHQARQATQTVRGSAKIMMDISEYSFKENREASKEKNCHNYDIIDNFCGRIKSI